LKGAAARNPMLPAANARRLVLLHDPVRRGAPSPTLTAVRPQARALAVHSRRRCNAAAVSPIDLSTPAAGLSSHRFYWIKNSRLR
jgi:hypothetical protein